MKIRPCFLLNPKWSVIENQKQSQIIIINQEHGGALIKLDHEEATIFEQLFLDCDNLFTPKYQNLVDKLVKNDIVWAIPQDYWEADFLDRQCRVSEEMTVTYVSSFTVDIQSVQKSTLKYQVSDMLQEVFKDFEESSLTIREIISNHSEQFVDEDKELVRKHLYRFMKVLLKEEIIVLC